MGVFNAQSDKIVVKETQKWQYINLSDFKNKSCLTFFSYVWIWIIVFVTIAVYAADTFTAVQLLKFGRWSSSIQPAITLRISKWIFASCIMFSWAICIYEWLRALRIMRKQSVTEDYLDPLAVVLQSIRFDGGWRRFLVFAELTKSKKKAAWVALFVYFQRKGCLRILGAEGPRMVVNALTLWSVVKANIIPVGKHEAAPGRTPVIQFFINLKLLAQEDTKQAVILSSMAFTLVIWVISMILLILALFFYIFFIWHYVKMETLTGYCRRKVETRLAAIVKTKVDKIWAKQQEREEQEQRREAEKKGLDVKPGMLRQPTLPVFDVESVPDKFDPFLSRNASDATLPRYTSQPQTPGDESPPPLPRQPTLPSMSRSTTNASRPYSPEATLLGHAGPMATSRPLHRPGTASSNRSYASSRGGPLPPLSTDPRYPSSSYSATSSERRYSPPSANSNSSTPWRTPVTPLQGNRQEYEMQGGPSLPSALRPAVGRRELSNPVQGSNSRGPLPYAPQRSFTAPVEQHGPVRSATPGTALGRSQTPGTGMTMNRSFTPGPGMGQGRSFTPGAPVGPSRVGTPGAGMALSRNMTPNGSPPRNGTPGPDNGDSPRSRTPGSGSRGAPGWNGGYGTAV